MKIGIVFFLFLFCVLCLEVWKFQVWKFGISNIEHRLKIFEARSETTRLSGDFRVLCKSHRTKKQHNIPSPRYAKATSRYASQHLGTLRYISIHFVTSRYVSLLLGTLRYSMHRSGHRISIFHHFRFYHNVAPLGLKAEFA